MRFADIEKFTDPGNYMTDVSVKYLPRAIEDYKEDFGLEMNPDFQRGNVWTREQQIAFLEFFFRGGASANVIYFNHPDFGRGAAPDSDMDHMVLVDGLQRLTAFLGFMNNEIPIFDGNYYKDFTDVLRGTEYNVKFCVNNLQYRRDVLKWYIEMNTGGTVHSKTEIARVQKLLDRELEGKKISFEMEK